MSARARNETALGVRRQPKRLALTVFKLPMPLYRRGWGWLLGDTFLLLVHVGRKTGKLHSTVAMALTYDAETHEAVICSVWVRTPTGFATFESTRRCRSQIARESFTPDQRFLSEDESLAVAVEFRRRHRGGSGCSRRYWAGTTSAPTRPSESSFAVGRSWHSVCDLSGDRAPVDGYLSE